MGIDSEGAAENIASLRAQIQALAGIDILKNEHEYKSTFDILDEIAQKWEELDDLSRAGLTELLAGKRQGNIMSSLMTNFDMARETLEVAENSAGSALIEHEKYMESIEAHLNTLSAAFEEFSQAFLNDKGLKSMIDAATGLLSILSNITKTIGSFPLVMGVAGGALSATKNIGRTNRRPLNMPMLMAFCPIGQFSMRTYAIHR